MFFAKIRIFVAETVRRNLIGVVSLNYRTGRIGVYFYNFKIVVFVKYKIKT